MIEKFFYFLKGTVSFTAENGFPERMIAQCGREELNVFDISATDTGIEARCFLHDFTKIKLLSQKYGVTIKKGKQNGFPVVLRRYKYRFMIPGMLLLILLLLLFSQLSWS